MTSWGEMTVEVSELACAGLPGVVLVKDQGNPAASVQGRFSVRFDLGQARPGDRVGELHQHRSEVKEAAARLGWTVVELDVDEIPASAREYGVLNVLSVAVSGRPNPRPVVGAKPADELVAELTPTAERCRYLMFR